MLFRCAWRWDITEERRPLLNVFLKRCALSQLGRTEANSLPEQGP